MGGVMALFTLAALSCVRGWAQCECRKLHASKKNKTDYLSNHRFFFKSGKDRPRSSRGINSRDSLCPEHQSCRVEAILGYTQGPKFIQNSQSVKINVSIVSNQLCLVYSTGVCLLQLVGDAVLMFHVISHTSLQQWSVLRSLRKDSCQRGLLHSSSSKLCSQQQLSKFAQKRGQRE